MIEIGRNGISSSSEIDIGGKVDAIVDKLLGNPKF